MRATCVICSDLFDDVKSIVVTPCGHVFHEECIYQWVDRSSTCPECRSKVTFTSVKKLYFSISSTQQSGRSSISTDHLENEIHALEAKLKEKDIALAEVKREKEEIRKYVRIAEDKADLNEQKYFEAKSENATLRLVVKDLKKSSARVEELQEMNKTLIKKIEHLRNVEIVVQGTQKDVDDIISSFGSSPSAVKEMATYFSLLKRELKSVSDSKQQLQTQAANFQKNLSIHSVKVRRQAEEIKLLREQIQVMEKENLLLAKQQQQARSSKSVAKPSKSAVGYESPMPERVKHLSENEFNSSFEVVTPVSERFIVEPLSKSQKLSGSSRPSISSIHVGSGFEIKMSDICNLRKNLSEDNDSTSVRLGYDGMGGHEKFIVRSEKAKFPLKRK